MKTVTIHEAKTHLSRLVNEALAGESIIIARRNEPLVFLQPIAQAKPTPRVGCLAHWNVDLDDFDNPELDEQIASEFLGSK